MCGTVVPMQMKSTAGAESQSPADRCGAVNSFHSSVFPCFYTVLRRRDQFFVVAVKTFLVFRSIDVRPTVLLWVSVAE